MNDNVPDLGLPHLILFILLSFAVARITRLVFKDTIFDAPRKAFIDKMMDDTRERKGKNGATTYHKRRRSHQYLREKLAELIVCPYCSSAYVTAVVLLVHRIVVEPFPMPVWWWFGVWMAAVVILEYTDGDGGKAKSK